MCCGLLIVLSLTMQQANILTPFFPQCMSEYELDQVIQADYPRWLTTPLNEQTDFATTISSVVITPRSIAN
ncbi:uncharacterized protein BP01DRAFT_389021 [Aspergillus saccharolyticus JOP 1030-1]|uniref:Uncharacterized protein n=1 Tax=Aspergillus saccharolyticus JOP 1030-1 TaxID=1450539 RepID=A0A318ZLJ5_9EURO|nr:hypothetical protein BP01DRAFT_389021 [Aspergillus saccharolyticus JOP 1030-1]PYH48396.1 hypothetical protein BP01DRAFT_389021 [Aspergillus saccharolyticus JOP 1030-1]